jgi:DNA-binding transcriptional regulator GbsR (MarR family)
METPQDLPAAGRPAGVAPADSSALADASAPSVPSAPSGADSGAPDPEALRAYIERFAGVLIESGIPRMPARVFVALMITDSGRLTSTELSDLLEISPAAVSGAVRYLTQVGMVVRERDPRSRRDRYRVLDDVFQEVIMRRDQVMLRWENSFSEGVKLLGADSPAGKRLTESVTMFRFLREEMQGLIERWYAVREAARKS